MRKRKRTERERPNDGMGAERGAEAYSSITLPWIIIIRRIDTGSASRTRKIVGGSRHSSSSMKALQAKKKHKERDSLAERQILWL